MSRPTPGPSRPLGVAPKPGAHTGPQPGGAVAANVPRRSAGAVPGIARTASSLRQSSPLASTGPLASLPAHLRNLSAPRIPSPLGKGTPARQAKQSLPVRTSKTTERHVFLPEDPQLAPLPKSPMGSSVHLAPPPRSQAGPSVSSMGRRESALPPYHHDERSDAEKMTKREREEARLPRLTAYDTAEGYRLKLLQAFLKREHGVGVVRVFDDCVYAVYNLPLLPGYGASTKIRSSPAVKSPGGISMMERMTLAEDLGYNDSYFPVAEETQPAFATSDPSEYILSHSPPSAMSAMELMTSMDLPVGQEQQREAEIEEAQERLETGDGLHDSPELRMEEEVGVRSALEHEASMGVEGELTPTDENLDLHSGHVPAPQPPPKPRRRKSHSTHNQVAEAVFYSYGVSVFFGFQEGEEREIMEDCEGAGVWMRGRDEDDWEVEEFHYVYDPDAEYPRIYNDMFTFKSHSHLFKLSLSHALAQSTKLSVYEATMQESLSLTSSFPKELSTTGHLQLNRREALKMTGRLFKLRMDVNLIGGILDTPELFWSEASLYPLYEAIREYLEIGPRVQVLNERLAVAGNLLEIIHEYIEERATHRITWIIIWLIIIACLVEVGEVVARVIFHNLPREEGEFLLVKGGKALVGAMR
ncbi:hypothetical protein EHS25_000370 [Saitozyma podzolica]|uniref:DUF155 domain-containing protein n=1 Tax=Saitozyma podzolica TaxID=1890683 RepID=A0A427YVX2_9TREE|nr:hypothetical protein EHS25_000370 [Saitozyma podzolica]